MMLHCVSLSIYAIKVIAFNINLLAFIINPKMDMQKIVTLDGSRWVWGPHRPQRPIWKKRNFKLKPSIVLCLSILLESYTVHELSTKQSKLILSQAI